MALQRQLAVDQAAPAIARLCVMALKQSCQTDRIIREFALPLGVHVPVIDKVEGTEGLRRLATNSRSDARHSANIEEPLAAWRDATDGVPGDPVRTYLHEISQMPLLTAEQELKLAQQIAAGALARQRLEQALYCSGQERAALECQYVVGHDARQCLIQANLRLVVSIAKRYSSYGLPMMDLIQEGNLGLIRALEKFDYTRGHRFATYATWWIRQGVTRAVANQSYFISLPVHVNDAIGKVKRAAHALQQALLREPTAEEIAGAIGISGAKVRQILETARYPLSLELPIGHPNEGRMGDLLVDDRTALPDEAVASSMLCTQIAEALKHLPERERTILQLRYGLADGRYRSLEEVGVEFGITRERVRQIEAVALRRLRHPYLGKKLRGYLETE